MKKVVITFTRPPHGTAHFTEGLRLASGMAFNEHDTKLIFTGDAVLCALKGVDREPAKQFLETINESGFNAYVDMMSLKEREIEMSEVHPAFTEATREEVAGMLQEADIHLGV